MELQYGAPIMPSMGSRLYLIVTFGLLPAALSLLSQWLLIKNRKNTQKPWVFWLLSLLMLPIVVAAIVIMCLSVRGIVNAIV